MSFRFTFSLLILILTLLSGSPAMAQVDPSSVYLEADSIEYLESENLAVARGNARLTYKGTLFVTEELEYDTLRGMVRTTLPFRILRDHEEIKGVGIEYYLEENVGKVGETLSLEGRARLAGEETHWVKDHYVSRNAVFSTCDRPDEEYHITAKQAVYYPGRKRNNLELTDASLYLYGTRIITLPSLTLTVGGKRPKQLLPMTQYSEQRGWSIYYPFDYMEDEKNSGTAVIEYYALLGFGGGFFHSYYLNEIESFDGMIRYLPDTGLQGGTIYHHLYPGGELQVALMRTDILNSASFTDYFTFYLITQLPEVTWIGNPLALGKSGFSFGYQFSYGDIGENLISSTGPSITQVRRSRGRGIATLSYLPIALSPSTHLSTGLSETYNLYNGGQEFQSVAVAQATLTQDLWKSAWVRGGYLHLMQGGLSPFNFDRRDISNNFVVGSFETPLIGDLKAGIGYTRDIDRNSDTLLDYTLKYATDCFYFGYTYGIISKKWSLDFKLLGID